jgi:hypothetical protein
MIFLVTNTCHFAKNKSPKQHGQGNFLENFQKILSYFEQESYENAKIFGGFEQISNFFFFLKSSYLAKRF